MIRRRGPAAAAAVVLLALSSVLASPARAQEESSASATMTLAARSDWIGDEPLTLDLALEGDVGAASIRVRAHRVLRDAAELATSQTEDVGVVISAPGSTPVAELPVVGGGLRRVSYPADFLGEAGVHPVVVDLVGADGALLDTIRTPVLRLGTEDEPVAGPRLSIAVDVGAAPTVRPDGRDELSEAALARFARLTELLEDAAIPATLLAVPDTVEALVASADPRSAALLDAMTVAGADRPAVLLPYVPTSVRALTGAELGDALGATRLAGAAVLADTFGTDLVDGVWPDADVDEAAAELLADSDMPRLLIDVGAVDPTDAGTSDGEPGVDDVPLTAVGPRPVPFVADGRLSAVVIDDRASTRLLEPALDGVDAGHVALADLLLRDDGRSSDVALRIDDYPEGSRLRAVLPLLLAADAPVSIVPLDVDRPTRETAPIGLAPAAEPDLTSLTEPFTDAAEQLAVFEEFVGPESARAAPLGLRLATSLGAAVSTDERLALVDSVAVEVRAGFDSVALTGQTDLNLTSRRGSLPVNVTNDNDYPVTLLIRLRSDRLRFPEGEELTVKLDPGSTRVDVPVEALTTGSVPTFVEVWTPGGEEQLDARQLNVRSTAFSGVGLALSLGALAVLGVWWIRNWRKNRKHGSTPSPDAT